MILAFTSITNANAAEVVAAGGAAIQSGDSVIDLSGVKRCDTAAVACVLEWVRQSHHAGKKLQLRGVPAAARSLAKLYGVESIVDAALAG